MEAETLKVILITIVIVLIVQLLFFYIRSIYIKWVTGFQPLFNPFERVSEWSNKDWIKGELYGRASTIQKYGLTKYCSENKSDLEAINEIEKWQNNIEKFDSMVKES